MKKRIYAGYATQEELLAMNRRYVGKLNSEPVGGFGPGRLLWRYIDASLTLGAATSVTPPPLHAPVWNVTIELEVVPHGYRQPLDFDGYGLVVRYHSLFELREDFNPSLANLRDVTPSRWQRVREEASLWWAFLRRRLKLRRLRPS